MEKVDVNIGETKMVVLFEDLYSELLGELNFLVALPTGDKFLMAYDFEKDRLAIQGSAPYNAIEHQVEIAERIEQRFL